MVLFLFEFFKVAKFKLIEKQSDFSQKTESKIKNFPRRRKPWLRLLSHYTFLKLGSLCLPNFQRNALKYFTFTSSIEHDEHDTPFQLENLKKYPVSSLSTFISL